MPKLTKSKVEPEEYYELRYAESKATVLCVIFLATATYILVHYIINQCDIYWHMKCAIIRGCTVDIGISG